MKKISILIVTAALFAWSCSNKEEEKKDEPKQEVSEMQALVNNYAEVDLTSDLVSELSDNQKQMLKKLIEVADIMEEVFWKEAIGEKQAFLSSIKDEAARRYAEINYGPWDRLDCNKAFIEGYGEKPKGACFYPADMTDEEFQALDENVRNGWYSVIRRNDDGSLKEVPYHEEYPELLKAADLLDEAAELAEDEGFKKYLKLRAEAFRTDNYFESDCARLDGHEDQPY